MESSPFDELVADLSTKERKALLDRIWKAVPVSTEPLFPASSAPGLFVKSTAMVDEFGFFARLILFLRGLFSGKGREELLREDELKEIAQRVEQNYVGIIDRHKELLLGIVVEELKRLGDAARFFYDAMDRSAEMDRPAFYAFLASIELPQIHNRLRVETDPAAIASAMMETRGVIEYSAVRNAALTAFDGIFASLPEKGRHSMYQDLRSVLFLKRLSGFLFDRLIGLFTDGVLPGAGLAAPFGDVRELLLGLGDILFSMSDAPSLELMEAIFMFAERDELTKSGEEAASLLGAEIAKAESSLERIRSFNARVPLVDILRLITRDPGYLPRELPGGEDWLAIYKSFWRERIESQLDEWRAEHRNKEVVEEISVFVGKPGPAGFAHISKEETDTAPPLHFDIALAFLDAFYRGPFLRELNRPLKFVLVDGDFYRKDNRVEFTDAYDALLLLPELLSSLDSKLGPDGELGGSWCAAIREIGPIAVKRRKMQSITRLAEDEAEHIIRRLGSALRTIVHIIQGFLKGEAGGRYDSLANLSHINGRSNKDFIRSLDRAKERCEKALILLAELSGLDLSRDE